jgi:hypothetical protein
VKKVDISLQPALRRSTEVLNGFETYLQASAEARVTDAAMSFLLESLRISIDSFPRTSSSYESSQRVTNHETTLRSWSTKADIQQLTASLRRY